MHMLYHVPEPDRAVRELRRITHPGGRVIVVLNGEDHLRELRGSSRRPDQPRPGAAPLRRADPPDQGEALLRAEFTSVTRHDFAASSGYRARNRSPPTCGACANLRLPDSGPLAAAVIGRLRADPDGLFPYHHPQRRPGLRLIRTCGQGSLLLVKSPGTAC